VFIEAKLTFRCVGVSCTLGWQDTERRAWADWGNEIWPRLHLTVFHEHN